MPEFKVVLPATLTATATAAADGNFNVPVLISINKSPPTFKVDAVELKFNT